MDVFWSRSARQHLQAIHDSISANSPRYADDVVNRIIARTEQLALFPDSGAVVPWASLLEIRMIVERPYRILYAVGSDYIDVLGVIHGSRDLR